MKQPEVAELLHEPLGVVKRETISPLANPDLPQL